MIRWLGMKVKFGNSDETQLQSDTQALRVSALGALGVSSLSFRLAGCPRFPDTRAAERCNTAVVTEVKVQVGCKRGVGHGGALARWLHPDDAQCGLSWKGRPAACTLNDFNIARRVCLYT